MSSRFFTTRALVEQLLRNANSVTWSLQGMGMLRTYLPGDVRLQVWDSRYRAPGVSMIHDHPWSFNSLCIAGRVRDIQYIVAKPTQDSAKYSAQYCARKIKPGEATQLAPDILVRLTRMEECCYDPGEEYTHAAADIHESDPADGTVTILTRARAGRPDEAMIYYPVHEQFGTAKPRPATSAEVDSIVGYALETWF